MWEAWKILYSECLTMKLHGFGNYHVELYVWDVLMKRVVIAVASM